MSRFTPTLVVTLVGALAAPVARASDGVLVLLIGNVTWVSAGDQIASHVQTAAGDLVQVDAYRMPPDTAPTDLSPYSQVWVVDYSQLDDDGTDVTAAWSAVQTWWNDRTAGAAVIFDGRALASRADDTEEGILVGDYYATLESQGGGLVFLTAGGYAGNPDTSGKYIGGANGLATALGFDPFLESHTWNTIVADTTAPPVNARADAYDANGHLPAGAPASYAPIASQPNGMDLAPVAWPLSGTPATSAVISWGTLAPSCSEICGCGVAETDTDGDGTPDCVDTCFDDPLKVDPGTCGCGVPETDTDGDGTPDCMDSCADDPFKIDPGTCGCGVAETDSDGDGVPDCIDVCPNVFDPAQADTDADGIGDACEPDTDGDGVIDDYDDCPGTADGALVDDGGCSIDDLCPCEGWSGHGAYVVCVVDATLAFVDEGLLTALEGGQTIAEHARLDCPSRISGGPGHGHGPGDHGGHVHGPHDGHGPADHDGHGHDGGECHAGRGPGDHPDDCHHGDAPRQECHDGHGAGCQVEDGHDKDDGPGPGDDRPDGFRR